MSWTNRGASRFHVAMALSTLTLGIVMTEAWCGELRPPKELDHPLATISSAPKDGQTLAALPGRDLAEVGQTLAPGDTVSVTIAALPGEDLANALVFSTTSREDNGAYEDAFPATVNLKIPVTFVGSFRVVAITRNSSGAFAGPLELSFPVVPSATLTAITVAPDLVIQQTPGDYSLLRVTGHYADGVYSTRNPAIVEVSADGKVTVVGDGQTTIRVQNSGVIVNVPVDVDHARFRTPSTGTVRPAQPVHPPAAADESPGP